MSARRHFQVFSVVGLAVSAALGANTQIIAVSPFLPVVAAGEAPSEHPRFELRGFMSAPDGRQFCIYDSQKKNCVWLGLNESGYSFMVTAADPAGDGVILRCNDGRQLSLAMRKTKVIPFAAGSVPQPTDGNSPTQLIATTGAAVAASLTPEQEDELKGLPPQREEALRRYFLNLANASRSTPSSPQ